MSTAAAGTRGAAARAAVVLGIAALMGMISIVWVFETNAERIQKVQAARLEATLQSLLPADLDNDPASDHVLVIDPMLGGDQPMPVYRARRNGVVVGSVVSAVAADGYSGAIELLVAIDNDGHVRGVRVTRHRETPGLGDAIEADRSPWILEFDESHSQAGDPPGFDTSRRFALKRQGGRFDAITGATITSAAVIDTVRQAHEWYRLHAGQIATLPSGHGWPVEPPP